ncbi:TIGR01777 family protein [Nitrincola tibetensis]|uniref:TIGR01777 family protein n=1 Tax=Nitrincola tibetensis TaxID=2219697 RepID=A0A364NLB2_9GAMM|nr:TIGR01777 family oxidoreductase [Nitrincola tibetensis]RAU17665.1 TIGR01777 family protein [Nitrincola tibetensis]
MNLLLTGGTGFIGRALVKALTDRGDHVIVLSRTPHKTAQGVRYVQHLTDISIDQPLDAVINLAGEPILDRRWSASRKQLLRESRIKTTASLVKWLGGLEQKPEVLVSGSAIGFYGSQQESLISEDSAIVEGFTHQLCADWEAEALAAEALGIRVCLARTGVVLGPQGGALAKMLMPFKLGLGGPVVTGKQWMSWIHLQDEVRALLYLVDNPEIRGAFNLTAPSPVTNEVFSKTLAKALCRPAIFRVPEFTLALMLGEGRELLVKGQRVVPTRLTSLGFVFDYPDLPGAISASI